MPMRSPNWLPASGSTRSGRPHDRGGVACARWTPSSSARRPAASRRCRCCCRRFHAATAGAVFVVLHLPRERPQPAGGHLRTEVRARGARGGRQGAGGAGHDLFRAVRLSPARRSRSGSWRCRWIAPVNFSRPSIDVLFESAAEVYGPRLLGIILTGANDDGAAGLEAVSRAGGTTCVQDPSTAYASLMTESALRRVRAASRARACRTRRGSSAPSRSRQARRRTAPTSR